MSKQIKTFEQLKDSRLLYDKKLPEYGYGIIIAFILLIVFTTIWSITTPKMDVIKSSGVVQSRNKNYVMSPYQGEIIDINVTNGMLVEEDDVLITIKSTDLDLQAKQLDGKRMIFINNIEQLKKLAQSIRDNTNYFDESLDEDAVYYYQYKAYESQISQQEVDMALFKAYGYTDEQIENEIQKNKNKISEIHYSNLRAVEEKIHESNNELLSIDIQLEAIDKGKNEYQIRANTSGKIHMMADFKNGMVVQAGTTIANISSVQDEYIIQAFISTDDIAKIRTGNSVDIAVSGLTQSVYGTIFGVVDRIDNDITHDSESGNSFFKADIIPSNNYLVSKNGLMVSLFNGMTVENRIQYDQVTYFNYLLESLGLWNR